MHDADYMQQAIALAKKGRFTTAPNPNVGCIIVKQGKIVGQGYHFRAGQPHAEIYALKQADYHAEGSTVYVTLEPCSHFGCTPPCALALIEAKVGRVVVAMQDPNPDVAGKGIALLRSAGIIVDVGLLIDKAEQLNKGFLKRMRTGLPYVQLKLAASLDGRTAMKSGESKWITGLASRQDVQVFRAESSAILTTSQTVISDNPTLTVRWHELPPSIQALYSPDSVRQPLCVVLDRLGKITEKYALFQETNEKLLFRNQSAMSCLPDRTHEICLSGDEQFDLREVMKILGQQQINTLWVESGATLAGALIQNQLVDELIIYMAPKLLGDEARPLCLLPRLMRLSQAPEFTITDMAQIGGDIRLSFIPCNVAKNGAALL